MTWVRWTTAGFSQPGLLHARSVSDIFRLLEHPCFQPHHPLRPGGKLTVVGRDQERNAVPVLQFEEHFVNMFTGAGVEVPRGFVGQNHDGLVDERARHRHPLLFASRQLSGLVVQPVPEPDLAQQRLGPSSWRGPGCRPE